MSKTKCKKCKAEIHPVDKLDLEQFEAQIRPQFGDIICFDCLDDYIKQETTTQKQELR